MRLKPTTPGATDSHDVGAFRPTADNSGAAGRAAARMLPAPLPTPSSMPAKEGIERGGGSWCAGQAAASKSERTTGTHGGCCARAATVAAKGAPALPFAFGNTTQACLSLAGGHRWGLCWSSRSFVSWKCWLSSWAMPNGPTNCSALFGLEASGALQFSSGGDCLGPQAYGSACGAAVGAGGRRGGQVRSCLVVASAIGSAVGSRRRGARRFGSRRCGARRGGLGSRLGVGVRAALCAVRGRRGVQVGCCLGGWLGGRLGGRLGG